MKRSVSTFTLLFVLMASLTAVGAQAPDRAATPDQYRMAAPSPDGRLEDISGSYAAWDGGAHGAMCWQPGTQTLCFDYHIQTETYAYTTDFKIKFEDGWSVADGELLEWSCVGGGYPDELTFHANGSEAEFEQYWYMQLVDACDAVYCVSVTVPPEAGLVSEPWYIVSDAFGGGVVDTCDTTCYYSCGEAVEPPAHVPPCQPGIYLTPPDQAGAACEGTAAEYTLGLYNNTGTGGTFDLAYNSQWAIDGPSQVYVENLETGFFQVSVAIPCGGVSDTATVTASGGGFSGGATLSTSATAGGWGSAWQHEPNDGSFGQQWGSCAVGPDGKNYYVGGLDHLGGMLDRFQVFDPVSSTWIQLPAPPTSLFGTVSGWIDGRLYVAGGFDVAFTGQTLLQIYDLASNMWLLGPDMPVARGAGSGGVAPCHEGGGECLYYAGGAPNGFYNNSSFNTYEFNPATDAWTQVATIPGNPAHYGITLGGGTACGGKIYIGGDYYAYPDFFGYDPATDTWTQLASLPDPAGKFTPALTCGPEGDVYLVGGDFMGDWGNTFNRRVYRYDVATDKWEQMPQLLNTGLLGSCALYNGDRLFTFGGTNGNYAIEPAPHESLGYLVCEPCQEASLHLNATQIRWAPWILPGSFLVAFRARVHDEGGAAVAGVDVVGTWTLPDGTKLDQTGASNDRGMARFRVKSRQTGMVRFCVRDLQKAGSVYDPDANEAPACRLVVVGP